MDIDGLETFKNRARTPHSAEYAFVVGQECSPYTGDVDQWIWLYADWLEANRSEDPRDSYDRAMGILSR